MLAVLLMGLLFLGWSGLVARWCRQSFADPAEQWGVAALIGPGLVGIAIFLVGLINLPAALGLAVILAVAGLAIHVLDRGHWPGISAPSPYVLVIAIALLIGLVNAIAPTDSMGWDALAYHLAVPKLWLQAGRITYIPFIHHSNFPFAIDALHLPGLQFGGEAGAKSVTWWVGVAGVFAVFGAARARYGSAAGWIASMAFAFCPVVLWEFGSGYIDVAHGFFAGLAMLAAADERPKPLQIALFSGLACATKYTGLQTVVAIAIVVGISAALGRSEGRGRIRAVALGTIGALVLAAPFLVRNVINTGNPVYPFLYERLGGRDWDQWRADIYRNEQQTFGVGRTDSGRDPKALGAAVLGLGYQPGRYINPLQTEGLGFPMGAIGLPVLAAGIWWLARVRRGPEARVLAMIGISFVMWFFLSQQSRYVVSAAVPLCVLAGGMIQDRLGKMVAMSVIGLQSAYSLYLLGTQQLRAQLPVVIGQVSRDDYLAARAPFSVVAKAVDELPAESGIALYDEVFGFFLNRPYFWANPGHCTRIPYERMTSGAELASALASLQMTHVYANLAQADPQTRSRWLAAMADQPYSAEEIQSMSTNLDLKWRWLFADAVRQGRFRNPRSFRTGVLFEIATRQSR